MLNFIYYPVSAIMWFWHKVFGFVFGEASAASWVLAVVFLVFTLRALLYKPFVSQVRSMRKMQEFAPEIQKLKKKYGNDRQKMAAEMQKLQSEQGVNPLGGCLPILVQIPVFIGLFHVLRMFRPGSTQNYVFGESEINSFLAADLFGANLGASIIPFRDAPPLEAYETTVPEMLVVMIPLMIAAGVLTHITARHSVARQQAAQAENPQTAIMNKLMLYVFPIGVVVGAPFLPLAVLLYWVANNLWTLAQQYVVYKRIDAEESVKREQAATARQARAPRPGQKPTRGPATDAAAQEGIEDEVAGDTRAKTPGSKPVARRSPKGDARNGASQGGGSGMNGAAQNGVDPQLGTGDDGAADAQTTSAANGAGPDGSAPDRADSTASDAGVPDTGVPDAGVPDAKVPGAKVPGGSGSATSKGRSGNRSGGGGSRPPSRRSKKRR